MSFYKTTPLDPQTLREAVVQAASQEAAILAIFQRLRAPMTPSMVQRLTDAAGKRWPLTSIRRAMSDLAREDGAPLVKTDQLLNSPFGRPEHCWRLSSPVERTV